jgi:hypothetical protein
MFDKNACLCTLTTLAALPRQCKPSKEWLSPVFIQAAKDCLGFQVQSDPEAVPKLAALGQDGVGRIHCAGQAL